MKQSLSFARRLAALVLAAVMLCVAVPAAFAEDAAPGATTIGGANTTLIPEEEENCLSWLFGSKDKITLPYLNIKGKGLRRNVSLDLLHGAWLHRQLCQRQRRAGGVEGPGRGHPLLPRVP